MSEISDLLPHNFPATSKTEENFLKNPNVFWSSIKSFLKSRVRNHSGDLLLPVWVVLKSSSQPLKASFFYLSFSAEMSSFLPTVNFGGVLITMG